MKTRSIETRFLSIVLSLLMVLTMLPAASFKAYADTGSNTPLTFTAQEDNSSVTIKLREGVALQYSIDGEQWDDYTPGTTIQLGNSGDTVYFRGTNNDKQFFDYSRKVSITGKVACSGNIMTLVDWQNPDNAAMVYNCFTYMFYGCTGLTTAPELPATTLADACYYCMFYGCTGLTTAPELPATTLAYSCYYCMFYGCTGLTTAPELPATTLADSCYSRMFLGCTGLTTAPELPATTLADACYYCMFYGCTGLTTAPELPATTLADDCYFRMFYGCTGLTTAPELPATTLAYDCYEGMFNGCTGLTTAPELPATTLANYCYSRMFYGCTGLTTAPELPATTLADSCYNSMFRGCTGLTTAPELPATTLANYCYHYMFYGCTGIMLSTTQTEECNTEYRIPSSGEGTTAKNALTSMFGNTGGTFTDTPVINTIYYTVKAHTHNFTYTASDAVITATCDAGNCDLTENKVTLTITAPTLTTYDGTSSASATLTGLTDFNDVTGKTVAESDIKYVGRDNTVYEESTTAPTDAGNYTASITVEEKTAAVNFTIAKADLTPDEVTARSATYGQTLANVTLPTANNGTWAWKNATTSVGNAGTHTFTAVFTPTNTNYNKVEQNVTVNVAKANMTPNPVSERNATYGQTLADVTLPTANNGTWAWKDPTTTSVGNAGTHTFAAVFTPSNTNYNTSEQNVTVKVAKANMTPNPVSERNATYGQTLADVTLPTANNGTWAWKDPTTTSVGNAGTHTFAAVFTPTNTNYNTVEQNVTVKVAKANMTPNPVSERNATYGQTLADVTLPTANNGTWAWKDPTTTSVGNAGTHTFAAVFTPTNTNYNTVEQNVTVKVAKANMTPNPVSERNATYGQTLADVTLPAANNGTWAWKDPTTTSVGNAGTHTFKAVFTPTNTNYNTVEQNVTVKVAKANMTPNPVSERNATYGQTLEDVTLPAANNGTWAWKDPTTTSVGNAGTHTFTAVFTPTNTNYNKVEQNVTVNVAKANMTPNPVSERNATYGQTLADVTLPTADDGTWAWENPTTTSVGNAGEQIFKAVFTPTNTNYNTVEKDVTVNVAKADLTPDEVTDLDAIYGQTLADVTLPTADDGTWAWEDDTTTSVGNAGEQTFKAVFTPTNTNYNTVEQNVTVNVAKADLTPDAVTDLNAIYGQTLANVTLPTADDGTWAWEDDTTTSVGNAGTHTFTAVFTPTNTNYNTVEQIVTVNVAKADPTPDEVTDLTAAYGKTLEDVALPNGWTWDAPETSVGNVGDNAFAATYTPDDTANYNTLNQDLTVTVVPVNKTALNDALTNANNYLDTIKTDADYAAPSSDLSNVIFTVNAVLTNDNVTEAQVAQAITDVNNAVTTAKSDVKDIDDTKAAQAVTNKINALTAAENVSTADKTDIEAARAAYDELTENQKAKVSADTLEKLTDAETALSAAEKDAADQAAANDVTSAINDLPAAEDITTADKTDIEAARKAYDELTDDQKAKVSDATKAKLEAAEEALAEAEKPVIKGDVNFDGKINVTDIVKVAAHVKGKKLLDKTAARAADVNGDSIIDVTDIIMIAAHIKGKKLL